MCHVTGNQIWFLFNLSQATIFCYCGYPRLNESHPVFPLATLDNNSTKVALFQTSQSFVAQNDAEGSGVHFPAALACLSIHHP